MEKLLVISRYPSNYVKVIIDNNSRDFRARINENGKFTYFIISRPHLTLKIYLKGWISVSGDRAMRRPSVLLLTLGGDAWALSAT